MLRYHFSLGNSTTGPIGYCAEVFASNLAEAIEQLRSALPEEVTVSEATGPANHIRVYFNWNYELTPEDIENVEIMDA